MEAKAELMAKAYEQDVSSLAAECERYIEAAESLAPTWMTRRCFL